MGIFSRKSGSVTHIYGPLAPCQISEKTNEPIPRKLRTDGRTDGQTGRQTSRWMHRQTLFYRTLLAEAGGLKIPKVDSNHTCLAVISLDSALKKDKNYYP